MFKDKKVVVVMPAYKAAQILRDTCSGGMVRNSLDVVVVAASSYYV